MNVDDIKNKAKASVIGNHLGYYGEVTEIVPNPYVVLSGGDREGPEAIWMAKAYILEDRTKLLEVFIIESNRSYRIMERAND